MLWHKELKVLTSVKGKTKPKKHKIVCQNRTEPRIYVSFDGKVWSCNWLGGRIL